jgi:hypothetical protein
MSGVGCSHLWVKSVKVDNTMLLKVGLKEGCSKIL